MKRIRVDFLIVGAGLAGSVVGFLLKKAGADVLALELLDAKTKEKLCGGMLFKTTPVRFAQVWNGICKREERCRTVRRYAGLMIAPVLPYVPTFARERRSKLNLATSLERTEPCRQCGACLPEETSGLGLRWKEWFRCWAGTVYLNIFPGRPDTAGTFHGGRMPLQAVSVIPAMRQFAGKG